MRASATVDSCSPGPAAGAEAANRTLVKEPEAPGICMTWMLPLGLSAPPVVLLLLPGRTAVSAPSSDAKACSPPAVAADTQEAPAGLSYAATLAIAIPGTAAARTETSMHASPATAGGRAPDPEGLSCSCLQLLLLQLRLLW